MSSSPIRCREPWKIHKRTSEPDRWLDEMGFFRKHTARDASCLFRAVSENIYNTQRYFHKVRYDCIQFMAMNRQLFEGSMSCPFDTYLKEISNSSEWGGFVEISAMSHVYRRDFIIFEANKGPQTKICNGYGNPIYLFYSSDTKHFDVVYTKDFINASSFCQSLVYEILYDGVYRLKDLPYAIDKMLHDKLPSDHIEYFMAENVERRKKQKERAKIFIETIDNDKDKNNNAVALKCKHHTEDAERASLLKESLSIFVFNRSLIQLENVCMNCLNVNSAKDLLDNGITPFPYKVAKALDPDIYRNIEFDVWSEMRREIRYGGRYSDGTTLQVGAKCLCRVGEGEGEGGQGGATYHAHVQELRRDGPCLVFIEELGEKRLVPFDRLEPLPASEARPWAPPYRYSRTHSQILTLGQMLQQIGNIAKKQPLKPRKGKGGDEKSPEKSRRTPKVSWNEMNEGDEDSPYPLDYVDFQPMPVSRTVVELIEVQSLPAMVDCRPAAAAAEPHAAPNGAAQPPPPTADNHHNQLNQPSGGSGDMGNHGVTSPASARASTPAALNPHLPYTAHYQSPAMAPAPMGHMGLGGPYASYVCPGVGVGVGGKGVVWVPLPLPPPHVNPHVYKSMQPNGADLPMNDISTLRFYFNLGVEYMWAAYGPPPPRHYSPRDIAQDMQQMSLQDRGHVPDAAHKHKGPGDKPALNNGKPASQRSIMGPRFNKRGNGQDGNPNTNHNQNNGRNNNHINNKPNNRSYDRRNSEPRAHGGGGVGGGGGGGGYGAEGEGVEAPAPMMTLPYIPYPPPVYPVQYYPVDSTDPAMMGMMGGMQYVPYEESVEFAPHYYPPAPPPAFPPMHHLPPAPHHEHK